MSNPRLDTPMMMNQDDMLAIEADRPSYPALMNGINNVTTSCMTPYGNTGYEEIQEKDKIWFILLKLMCFNEIPVF